MKKEPEFNFVSDLKEIFPPKLTLIGKKFKKEENSEIEYSKF